MLSPNSFSLAVGARCENSLLDTRSESLSIKGAKWTAMTKSSRARSVKIRMISNSNKYALFHNTLCEKSLRKLEFGELKIHSNHRVSILAKYGLKSSLLHHQSIIAQW